MFTASSMLIKGHSKPFGLVKSARNVNFYRNVYLNSEHWKNLRNEKLLKNPTCQRCGRGYALQVHHVRYGNLYDVGLKDLETLCQICHEKEHKKLSKKKHDKHKSLIYSLKRIKKDKDYWIELGKLKNKLDSKEAFLSPKNKERQEKFDKKYPKIPYELNNYISIHY